MSEVTSRIIEQAEKARDFPNNTCGPSRHAHMLAEQLMDGSYLGFQEDPRYCGETLLLVLTALWKARTQLNRLKIQVGEE